MIERLIISNFQCHDKLDIELDPNITCITGPSDVGKSSIIRALRWGSLNKPGGQSFRKHGISEGKDVQVSVQVDGHTIRRVRGNQQGNLFELDNKSFHAFGQDVPEEIINAVNLSEANFSLQHQPAWWFFLSAGEVSKQLNSIVNLELIDFSLANLASELRKAKSFVDVSEERLQSLKKEESNLSWVARADKDLLILEKLEAEKEETFNKKTRLEFLQTEVKKIREVQSLADQAVKEGSALVSKIEKLNTQKGKLNKLSGMHQSWQELCSKVTSLQRNLSSKNKKLQEELAKTCPLCGRSP